MKKDTLKIRFFLKNSEEQWIGKGKYWHENSLGKQQNFCLTISLNSTGRWKNDIYVFSEVRWNTTNLSPGVQPNLN
jgi:hypothetical protein